LENTRSRSKIFIVDDDITNLTVGKNALAERYDVFTAPSGTKMFQLLEKLTPEMILLDIGMPDISGYEIIEELKGNQKTAEIPVIFLTSNIDPESEVKGLSLGAIDYITKPFSRELLLKRIEVHLLVEAQKKELKDYSQNLEKMVDKKTETVFELQNAILKTVAELVESRDSITGGHIERTQKYLALFINLLLEHGVYTEELSLWDINLFIMSSQLHDVGKITIKDNILMKTGKLSDEETEEMKKHTTFGIKIIEKIEGSTPESAFLKHAKILAGSHHERWDGTGYPFGLKGVEIPLQGRLMALIDVYDALTNDRSYKKAFSHEGSIEIIKEGKGTQFDPILTDIFLKHEKDFKKSMHDYLSANMDSGYSGFAWEAVSYAVDAIMNAETDMKSGHLDMDRIRCYLKILIDALLKDDRYRDEITPSEKEAMDESLLLQQAGSFAGSRHERWDKGAIPLPQRMMAVVDVYHTLTTDCPYIKRMPHQTAVDIIKDYSGTYFDPMIVNILLDYEKEFMRVESFL